MRAKVLVAVVDEEEEVGRAEALDRTTQVVVREESEHSSLVVIGWEVQC